MKSILHKILGLSILLILFFISTPNALAGTLEIKPDNGKRYSSDKITFRYTGCTQSEIQSNKPMYAVRQDEVTKGWNGGVGKFEGNVAVFEHVFENPDKYFLLIECQGDGKTVNQQTTPNFDSASSEINIQKEPPGTGVVLAGPSEPVKNKVPLNLNITGIQSCIETKNTAYIQIVQQVYTKITNDIKNQSFSFGQNESLDYSFTPNIEENGEHKIDITVLCGPRAPGDPNVRSNKITLQILTDAEIENSNKLPRLTIEPNPVYKNKETTFTATNLNENGCLDGSPAVFHWQNTKAAGRQKAESNPAPLIQNNKAVYTLKQGFDNTDEKEVWVVCRSTTQNKDIESSPHDIVRPVGPILSPPPPPPPAPCQTDQGTKDSNGMCLSLNTAFGKIDLEPSTLISTILRLLLSLAGGIALFIIIRSGYTLMTSQGNPEKVKEAREALTSAVVGLLFMIFSVMILQVIGVSLLRIPGFS